EAIAMNFSNSAKISSSRMVPSMEWRNLLPSSRRAVDIKDHSFSPNSKIELFLFTSNYCISSVKKGSSRDERKFAIFFHFENNKIGRKGLIVLRDSFAYKEYGIRLMLAPRMAELSSIRKAAKMLGFMLFKLSTNMAFVSAKSTSSINELNGAYSVSTATSHSSQAQVVYSSLQVDNEDQEQIDQDDLEEMDLKWQVAMLSMRVKRFYKKTRRKLEFNGKEPVGFDKTKVKCFNCHRRGHFARDCRTARNIGNRGRDAENVGYKGRYNGVTNFALMAFTSNPSSSSCSNSEEEVTETVFDNRSSKEENILANDRFKKGKRFHVVPPPLTWNYMPPKPDLSFAGLDDSIYKFTISETVTSLSKDEKDAPKTSTAFVEKPKEVRTNAPLIRE
nr:ribonuclease H-like domain-containing protein [Tanacetum cinerariifolium]